MKRFSVLLLLLLLLLSSCTAPTGRGEATSGEEVATGGEQTSTEVTSAEITSEEVSDSITETEPIEIIHPTLKPTDFSKEDFQIGMPHSEVIAPFGEEYYWYYGEANYVEYNDYIFLIGKNGDSIVIRFDDDYNVAEVRVYPPRTSMPTDADFAQIELGMSVFDLIELVGLPSGVAGFGFIRVYWHSEEKNIYALDWYKDAVEDIALQNR